VLAQGGALSVVIAADGATGGTLTIPASVTGGSALNTSMTGTALRSGNTVRFQQTADTFVRDLTWTVGRSTLQVNDQALGGARFTIALSRP
jgi:hypothetical protein